jgi:hypothetical protein
MAASTSLLLADDSYAHFAQSVAFVRAGNWAELWQDTWNKPLPGLIYGVSGQWGILAARWTGIAFVVAAAALSYGAMRRMLGTGISGAAVLIGLWFAQLALFPQAFLTMTELLAAFWLAAGLFALSRERFVLGFLALGLAPLARIETMLAVFASVGTITLVRIVHRREGWIAPLVQAVVAGVPWLAWWTWGWIRTGEATWMSASYVYLRDPGWISWLRINAVTGLAAVLSPPQLLLFALGACALVRRGAARIRSPSSDGLNPAWILALVMLTVHFLFLSLAVVYPRGSGFGGQAIAALNNRNYNVLAPFLFLVMGAGWKALFSADDRLTRGHSIKLAVAIGAALVAGGWLFRSAFLPAELSSLLLIHTAIAAFLLAGFLPATRLTRRPEAVGAAYCVAAMAILIPFCWYPLRSLDRQESMQREICSWLKTPENTNTICVVQDLNGSLNTFGGFERPSVIWTYPHLMKSTVFRLPAGSVVILETDHLLHPRGRYPADLIAFLEDDKRFTCVARSAENRPALPGESLLWRLSGRNAPCGWLAYRRVDSDSLVTEP